jgi:DNA repair protein RecN (Recombination protein N)
MLRFLSLRDYVIVDRLELECRAGFTVLTGETGAGKSILIDALSLTLGERAEAGVVRLGADRTEVCAEFDVEKGSPLRQWLQDNELQGDDDACVLRRIVDSAGRSRAFLNGRSVNLHQFREAGDLLVDIHGQHAHQSLLRPETQRNLLDAYGGLGPLADEVAASYDRCQALSSARLEWEANATALSAEKEALERTVSDLNGLDLAPERWQELVAEHARLAHAAALLEGAQSAVEGLSDSEAACLPQLTAVGAMLRQLSEYDAALGESVDLMDSARIQLQEAVQGLRRYALRVDLDPERLREVEGRLDQIHRAARKYRAAPEELAGLLDRSEARLAEIAALEPVGGLREEEEGARRRYLAQARELGARRREAAKRMSDTVSAAMAELAMEGGRFVVELMPIEHGTAHGFEQAAFLVSAHRGLPAGPLNKVASGGELSRVSLAIQVVAANLARVPTLIFDEVDTGIGGRAAEIVGQMLKKLGSERQVLCVTHLPQVAACGDHHWRVSKTTLNGAVSSEIQVLDEKARVEELARMMGGVEVTATTRRHAAEMLAAGRVSRGP